MLKHKGLVSIIASCFFVVGIVVCLIACSTVNFKFSEISTNYPSTKKSIDIEDTFETLEIEVSNAEVKVLSSQDDDFHIDYYENKKEHFIITTENNTLKITNERNYKWYEIITFNIYKNDCDLVVYIPSSYVGELSIDNKNGDVVVKNFNSAESILINTSNGSINMINVSTTKDIIAKCSNDSIDASNIQANSVTLKTRNDDIDVSLITVVDSFTAITNHAGIELSHVTAPNSILCETTSDDIELKLISSSSIVLRNDGGDIEGTITGSINDYKIDSKTKHGENNLYNKSVGEKYLYVTTSSADIEINFSND